MGWASASMADIRIVLTGAQKAVAGLEATRGAVVGLKDSVRTLGVVSDETKKRGFLMNQALFSMRRYAYMGTLALTGAAAVAVKWGYDFNSAMQSASVALKPVMQGTGAVRGELEKLFNIAKYSSFQFKDVTIGFRSMYLAMQPLGISADTVNKTMQAMIDALSATGRTSPANLNRVSVALQHMAYQGRLTGFTVNQLARDGIPIFGALSKELGVTGTNLHNISKLGIPAQAVLDAINKYIETTPAYMNAAYRQAQTLHGELTTLRDNIAQTMGALTLGGFNKTTTGILPAINHMFDKISAIIVKQKGRISIGQVFGVIGTSFPWMRPFISLFNTIISAVKALFSVIKNDLLPTIIVLGVIFQYSVFPVLRLVLWGIKELSKANYVLVPILTVVIGLWMADKAVTMAVVAANRLLIISEAILNILLGKGKGLMAGYMATQLAGTRIQELWGIATGKSARAANGQFRALTAVEKMARKLYKTIRDLLIPAEEEEAGAATTAWVASLGPIAWIIAAIVAVIAILVILYFKWKWFHNLVNTTFHWIWEHWILVAAILTFIAPIFAVLLVLARLLYNNWHNLGKLVLGFWNDILKPFARWLDTVWNMLVTAFAEVFGILGNYFKPVYNFFKMIYDWVKKIIDKLTDMLGLWKKIPGATFIVGLAKGAYHVASNLANAPGVLSPYDKSPAGPPKLIAPGGALTSPLYGQGLFQIPKLNAEIHVHSHIDGKQVAYSVAKANQKARARSTTHG